MAVDRRAFLRTGALLASAPLVTRTAFAQGATSDPYFADLYEKAKKEGEVTWYIGHWRTETAESVGGLFTKLYPGVRCNVVRATVQVLYQRLNQDMKAKVSNCDVFSSTDLGQYV